MLINHHGLLHPQPAVLGVPLGRVPAFGLGELTMSGSLAQGQEVCKQAVLSAKVTAPQLASQEQPECKAEG